MTRGINRKTQKGFSPIEIILTLVIVGLIGGTGWYVWNAKNNSDNNYNNADQASSSTAKYPSKDTESKADQNVIKIKELGIELTVPDSIKDLLYNMDQLQLDNGEKYPIAEFSTQKLTDLDKGCSADKEAPPLGHLSKVNGQYPQDADVSNAAGVLVKQFGSYYIGYTSPQAACSDNESVRDTAIEQMQIFKSTFSTLKEI